MRVVVLHGWNKKPAGFGRPRKPGQGHEAAEHACGIRKGPAAGLSAHTGTARRIDQRSARSSSAHGARLSQEPPWGEGIGCRLGRVALVALLPSGSSP